jgi:hypothetical protein
MWFPTKYKKELIEALRYVQVGMIFVTCENVGSNEPVF